jgi:secondary thiamine-phosphate synthase enzyme
MIAHVVIETRSQGLHEVTGAVADVVAGSGVHDGLCTVFVQHTSASIIIQENADPTVRADLEAWLNRLVPEDASRFTHTIEGPDDMPSHIKAALTATSVSIPIITGRLAIGRWQGIYLWEHRREGRRRELVLHISA